MNSARTFRCSSHSFASTARHVVWLWVCLSATACGSRPWPDPGTAGHASAASALQSPDAQRVTLVGRFETLPKTGAVRWGWPNSAVGFNFDGDSIGIVLAEDAMRTVGTDTVHNMYEVVVDGEVMSPVTVTSTTPRTFAIGEGLFPGPHTVWVIKRTEGMVGSGIVMGLDVPPQTQLLPPPPPRTRRIAVYGASNEAGYGNLGKATQQDMCTYTTATQNAAVAYPALVAIALRADLVNVAFSGKGMVGSCTPGDTQPLPGLADRIDPLYPKAWPRDPQQDPQVIVVTLGANDFASGPPNRAKFHKAYGAFLHKLRRHHPHAAIICTVTPMIGGADRVRYKHWLHQIVADAHDARISILEFPMYTGKTFGCDSHPDEALHRALAQRLQKTITRVTGWH